MPLGGLLPYDEEEERRRRLGLPPAPLTASPTPPTSMSPPAGTERPMMPARIGRGEEIGEARDVYMQGTPGRGRSALSGVLGGLVQGLKSSQGLGGGVRGAVAGGLHGAIDPRGLREDQFNQRIKPKIVERFGMEDMETAKVRQAEEDALNTQYKTAQIGALNRSNMPSEPGFADSPLGIYNKRTGAVTTPALPKEPAPDRRFTNRGMVDVSKLPPEELQKLTPYQRPREKSGGGGGSSKQDMRSAGVLKRQFDRIKSEAIQARQTENDEVFNAKMYEMQELADQIDAQYGDVMEVGEGDGWPYVKFRQGGGGRKQQRPAPKGQKADPLGIR